jgi:hypothetical protein
MSPWDKIYGARRRAIDRRLLASMEREIAAMEKKTPPAEVVDLTGGLCEHFYPPAKCVLCARNERDRIARAFGRPA